MKNNDLRTLTRLALLVAIELVMKAIGLGSVPMGPLYMWPVLCWAACSAR